MEFLSTNNFNNEKIVFQFKTESDLYIVTREYEYKLFLVSSKHPKGKLIKKSRKGSEVMECIPSERN